MERYYLCNYPQYDFPHIYTETKNSIYLLQNWRQYFVSSLGILFSVWEKKTN